MDNSFQVTNYKSSASLNIKAASDKNSNKLALELGNIISATITEKTDDKTTLLTKDGKRFEAASDKVTGQVGDEVQFEVIKSDSDGVTLKQINIQRAAAATVKRQSLKNMKELFRKNNYISNEDKTNELDAQLKEMQTISRIKKQLKYMSNNSSSSALRELLKSGMSLSKISFNILSTVMKEIDSKPLKQSTNEEFEAIINKALEDNAAPERIAKALSNEGLPLTEENIKSLESVLAKLKVVESPGDDTIAKLIKEEKPITLENIYISKFSAAKSPEENQNKEDFEKTWQLLKPELERIFSRNGIEKTADNFKAARLLVENEIDISKENIDKVNFLKNIQSIPADELLQKAAHNIKLDKPVAEISLIERTVSPKSVKKLLSDYNGIIKDLPRIGDWNIKYLISQNRPVTLNNLRETLNLNYTPAIQENTGASFINTKKQLIEIQLKLNSEAAYRLANKNISIPTMPLEEALNHLRDIDSEKYEKSLKIVQAEATAENISKMNDLYTRLSQIRPLTNNVFSNIINKNIPFTISEIHKSVMADRLIDNYEIFATAPVRKFGDTLSKIEDQYPDLLKSLEIEPNQENIKAAKILTKNNMDINAENLDKVKLIDLKISNIYNRLHPNIAASMVKEGLDPSEMHIDDVLEYIGKFNDVYGEGLGDKISSYILQLDDSKTLTEQERSSMIAIYRMLNQIQKDDSAAIGLTLKHGRSIKLGDMLEDSKYYQKSKRGQAGVNVYADNSLGPLHELISPEGGIKNILSQNKNHVLDTISRERLAEISNVLSENLMSDTSSNLKTAAELIELDANPLMTQTVYNRSLLDNITMNASPENLHEMMNRHDNLMEMPSEDIASELQDLPQKSSSTDIEAMNTQLQELLKTPEAIISWMQNNQIPANLINIKALRSILNDGNFVSAGINQLNENAEFDGEVLDTDLSKLQEGISPDTLLSRIQEHLGDLKDEAAGREKIQQVDALKNAVLVKRYIQNRSSANGLSLPVKLHNKISDLNIYVLNNNLEQKDDINMLISLDTEALGNVQVYIKGQGNDAELAISSDNPNALLFLQENSSAITSYLKDSEFNINSIIYEQRAARNVLAEEINQKPDISAYTSGYETTV